MAHTVGGLGEDQRLSGVLRINQPNQGSPKSVDAFRCGPGFREMQARSGGDSILGVTPPAPRCFEGRVDIPAEIRSEGGDSEGGEDRHT